VHVRLLFSGYSVRFWPVTSGQWLASESKTRPDPNPHGSWRPDWRQQSFLAPKADAGVVTGGFGGGGARARALDPGKKGVKGTAQAGPGPGVRFSLPKSGSSRARPRNAECPCKYGHRQFCLKYTEMRN